MKKYEIHYFIHRFGLINEETRLKNSKFCINY